MSLIIYVQFIEDKELKFYLNVLHETQIQVLISFNSSVVI